MKRLAVIGDELIHKFIYPGHINGFDAQKMHELGGWMADMHKFRDGQPLSPDVRITAIASPDPDTEAIAQACLIDRVYSSVADLPPDSVDGVLIMENDGSRHLALSAPYLRRGLFVYIDKPVAVRAAELAEMQRMATASGAVLMGGSALRYSPKLQDAATYLALHKPSGVTIAGPGTWYEYACHTVEALEVIFGPSIIRHCQLGTVQAGSVTLEWENGMMATVQFGRGYQPLFRIHSFYQDDMKEWIIDDAPDYYLGLSKAIIQNVSGLAAKYDPWPDLHAITRVLEDVGAQFPPSHEMTGVK